MKCSTALIECNALFLKAYDVLDVKPSFYSAALAWHRAQANGSCSLTKKPCYNSYPVLASEANVVFSHCHLCFALQFDAGMIYKNILDLEASR